jgi:tRNA-guanine family transglycosylase
MIRLLGDKALETPAIIVSYRVGDYPAAGLRCYPWQMTGTRGILLNAFDLLGNRRTRESAEQIRRCEKGINEYINFNGPVILDSGAFNFMKQEDISITPVDVLDAGLRIKSDVLVVLDHPFPPSATADEVRIRLARTQANTRAMFDALSNNGAKDNLTLMPVLHGHDTETLERSLESILSVTDREPSIVGIGSLAPLARQGYMRKAVDVILQARRMLPHSHIHVFSMGSALLMLFAFYCGADTVDSQTWIMTAAFKQAQLPGLHQTRFSHREAEKDPDKYRNARIAFVEQLLRLGENESFTVRDWDTGEPHPVGNEREAFAYLDRLEDRDGDNRVHWRACHNLYSFNFETGQVRRAMEDGSIEILIGSRVERTNYRRAFEYAVQKKAALHLYRTEHV